MIIIRKIEDLPTGLPDPVVTIGNFDGVHLGHRQLFRRVKHAAARLGGVSIVLTFMPHPLKVLAPDRNFRLITTYAEKEALIRASGIDYLITLPFSREFATLAATDFVRDILVHRIGIRKLIIGYDYAFGRNREGDVHLLRRLGQEYGFAVEVLEQVTIGETVFSSSLIRSLLEEGEVKKVLPLLGRYYSIAGKVVYGQQRGQQIGFPTANVEVDEELLPKRGVYAVKILIDGQLYDGACNIGFNPTFSGKKLSVEAHIFDFTNEIYGKEVKVYFVERLRDEQSFPTPADLMLAIGNDVTLCRKILGDVKRVDYHEDK